MMHLNNDLARVESADAARVVSHLVPLRVGVWPNQPRVIFCFGSNLAGRHAAGAARDAMDFWGAEDGYGEGLTGEAYAIPTCDECLHPLSIERIAEFVNDFIGYALAHPEQTFYVTRIGCGIAGYSPEQIAPLFVNAPSNVQLPAGWREMGTRA